MPSATTAPDCHPLCALAGAATCSLAIHRSRGCRPNVTARDVDPAIFTEVRALLATLAAPSADPRDAATRLAAIIRREALDDRHLLAHARSDEPDLVPALEHLTSRPTSSP